MVFPTGTKIMELIISFVFCTSLAIVYSTPALTEARSFDSRFISNGLSRKDPLSFSWDKYFRNHVESVSQLLLIKRERRDFEELQHNLGLGDGRADSEDNEIEIQEELNSLQGQESLNLPEKVGESTEAAVTATDDPVEGGGGDNVTNNEEEPVKDDETATGDEESIKDQETEEDATNGIEELHGEDQAMDETTPAGEEPI